MIFSFLKRVFFYFKGIFHKFKRERLWRAKNQHNETVVKSNFDQSKVSVGKRTYGNIDIKFFGNDKEKLTIGNYVSIADDVKFLLGGNHPYEGFSTYPYLVKVFGEEREATTKGEIIVEDDAWIGMSSIILSGVKIGKGAVIAAGSVIAKDVPPYAIVGGNPAKVIKYRFSGKVIEELQKLDFSKIDDEVLIKNKHLLYEKLTDDNVKSIVNSLMTSL